MEYMEIKKIKSQIWISDYVITFEYDTKRHNHKKQQRVITTINKHYAQKDFWLWINTINEDKPYRAMANVTILDIEEINGRYINL